VLIPQKGSLFFYLCSFKYLFQHRKTGRRKEEVSPGHCVSVGSSAQRDGEGNLSVVSVEFSAQQRLGGGNPSPMCSVGLFSTRRRGRNPPCRICVGFDATGRETSPLCLHGFSNTSGERNPPCRICVGFSTRRGEKSSLSYLCGL
jgi:hypothetical protein